MSFTLLGILGYIFAPALYPRAPTTNAEKNKPKRPYCWGNQRAPQIQLRVRLPGVKHTPPCVRAPHLRPSVSSPPRSSAPFVRSRPPDTPLAVSARKEVDKGKKEGNWAENAISTHCRDEPARPTRSDHHPEHATVSSPDGPRTHRSPYTTPNIQTRIIRFMLLGILEYERLHLRCTQERPSPTWRTYPNGPAARGIGESAAQSSSSSWCGTYASVYARPPSVSSPPRSSSPNLPHHVHQRIRSGFDSHTKCVIGTRRSSQRRLMTGIDARSTNSGNASKIPSDGQPRLHISVIRYFVASSFRDRIWEADGCYLRSALHARESSPSTPIPTPTMNRTSPTD